MTVYSFGQLQELWKQNGGDPTYAPIAAAIALAESGGRSDNVSKPNKDGSQDWGVWQINKGGSPMLDPNANAKTAIAMSKNGKNWHPWCTAYGDAACGTKGGGYMAPSSPFWKFLTGTGAKVPTDPAFPTPKTVPMPPATNAVSSKDDNPCLISLPSIGPIGGGCIIRQSQGRAILGGLIVAAGVGVGIVGAALLASKLTGASMPKMALTAAAPEAAPAMAAVSSADSTASRRARMRSGTKSYDANGTEITASDANKSPGKRQAYKAQEASKHPATVHTSSDGSTF